MPLTSSSPLTERQRHGTQPPPGRNDRAAGNVTTFFFFFFFFFRFMGDCLELPTNKERMLFFNSGSKSRLGFRETQALSRMLASGSEAHFAAKGLGLCSRRAPLQAGSSVQRISACSWRAHSGSHRLRGPCSWRGREHSKSVRPQRTRRTRGIQGGKCPTRQVFRACSTSGGGSGLVQIVSSVKISR